LGAKALRAEKQGQRDCHVMVRRLQACRLRKSKNVLRRPTMSVLCISPRSPSLLDACRHLEELPGAFANQLSKCHCLKQWPVRPAAGRCEAPEVFQLMTRARERCTAGCAATMDTYDISEQLHGSVSMREHGMALLANMHPCSLHVKCMLRHPASLPTSVTITTTIHMIVTDLAATFCQRTRK
jgi:hypothetical protein